MNSNDRANLIKRINTLEGLTDKERSALLGLLRENKTYGLVWEDKPEDVEERLRDELPILTEVPEHAIISEDKDAPNHILIEGDNLEALATLAYTHEGKIDVIYIDPPYNRGENDFKYNDKFIDKDNPFRHSLWLNFMCKRLKLAKKLLKDDGVIIIHIDEHEYNALNLLLETEIFSNNNNLGTIIWNKMNPKGDAKGVASMHEFIILYAKNKDLFLKSGVTLTREKPNAEAIIRKAKNLFSKLGKSVIPEDVLSAIKPFNYNNKILQDFTITYDLELINKEFQSWLAKSSFGKGEKAYKYISSNGRVFRSVSMAWPNKEKAPDDYWIPLKHPITGIDCPLPSKGWRNPSKTMNMLLGNDEPYSVAGLLIKGDIVFSQKKNGTLNIPERIYYLDENLTENVPSIYNDGTSNDSLLDNLGVSFEYPKTISVATYLLKNIKAEFSTVLDFFAGSGTTLHATMQLNAEDGGHRQCILITNNENNICEEVTYERNRRVIQGYTNAKGEEVSGLTKNNLRYYRTGFVGRSRSMQNMRKLVHLATDMLCIKENLYTEQNTFGWQKTYKNVFRYFDDGKKQMLIIYREEAIDELVDIIYDLDITQPIKVYVFSPSEDPWEGSFDDVSDKVELCALPQAIYNTYRRILPKKKDAVVMSEEDALATTEEEKEQFNGMLNFEYDEEA
jgi:adenine-specific DNA-methyltransferase